MNRSQRIALAMRGHRPKPLSHAQRIELHIAAWERGPRTAALRHARYILHGIPSTVVVTETPTTFVLLAREKGLPCS